MSAQQNVKIFRYIFSLLAFTASIQMAVCQQNKSSKTPVRQTAKKLVKPKAKAEPQPFFRAITAQADIAGPFISKLGTSGVTYYEASVDVNLRNKWFPVWEIGYASINHLTDGGAQFVASGIYNRIGVNVNLLKVSDPKKITQSILFVGLRFGFAPFTYDIHNLSLSDEYWNRSSISNFDGLKASAKWGEFVAGLRMNIFKNVTLGWSGRLKMGLSTGSGAYSPWYVPGYGINDGAVWGFTYNVGYTIPLK